jgi:hypothetical protein
MLDSLRLVPLPSLSRQETVGPIVQPTLVNMLARCQCVLSILFGVGVERPNIEDNSADQ